MTDKKLKAAEAEAKRFLARVSAWRQAQGTYEHSGFTFHIHTPRENGAVRRASLDLTRALADLRRRG